MKLFQKIKALSIKEKESLHQLFDIDRTHFDVTSIVNIDRTHFDVTSIVNIDRTHFDVYVRK